MASDLLSTPLIAFSAETKEYIANMLNPTKFLPNENGCRRDWRGLLHLLEINAQLTSLFEFEKDPTKCILERIEKNKNITIKDFQVTMEQMDRWDIISDTQKMFENDAVKYLERQQIAQVSADPIEVQIDREILTVEDAYRLEQGLETARYDAFLLYADEDAVFANEIMQKLQTEYKLKLCYNEDLIAGLPFEHEAVMRLISERCNRLLVVLSPYFIKHPANKFFLSYTQALSIEKQQRIIVPCIYKHCPNMPHQLQYISRVDYTRRRFQDIKHFWAQLFYSIKTPGSVINSNTPILQLPVPPITQPIVQHSDMIPELTKMSNIVPDSDIIPAKETNEGTSRYSLQNESDILPNMDDKASNADNKKSKKSLHKKMKNGMKKLIKKDWVKGEQSGQSQSQLISETIPHLPSPPSHDLSSLSLSSISLNISNNDICKDEETTKQSSKKKKSSPKFPLKKKIALLAS